MTRSSRSAAGTTSESPRGEQPAHLRARPGGQRRQRHRPARRRSASHSATPCPASPSTSRSAAPYHSPSGGRRAAGGRRAPGAALTSSCRVTGSARPRRRTGRPGHQRHAGLDGAPEQRDLVGPEGGRARGARRRRSRSAASPPGAPASRSLSTATWSGGCAPLPVEVGHVGPGDPGAHPVVAGPALQRPHPQRARAALVSVARPAAVARRPGRRLELDLERERLVGALLGRRRPGRRARRAARTAAAPSAAPGRGARRACSSRTVISSASACLQPSATGQLHRPKTQTPSPSTPTLTLTAYGALVDPATVPRMSRSPSESRSWVHDSTLPRRT